jgi:hypothetical protein
VHVIRVGWPILEVHVIHVAQLIPEVHVIHVAQLIPVVPGELTILMQTVTETSIVKPKVAGRSETAVAGLRANAPLHN